MPRVRSFDELTDNPDWAEQIRRVYNNDIDKVDLQIGMYAEPTPPGFGFSDTAFRVFILMASRRLKSDRFFTVDFTPEMYTPEGMAWLDDNTMSTVLLRHYPELSPALRGVRNPFAPWVKEITDRGITAGCGRGATASTRIVAVASLPLPAPSLSFDAICFPVESNRRKNVSTPNASMLPARISVAPVAGATSLYISTSLEPMTSTPSDPILALMVWPTLMG